jgi:hypothetical protein
MWIVELVKRNEENKLKLSTSFRLVHGRRVF